ncbi:MAG TPA: hypothetical protein VJY33_22185 [Isosphaeraceae bacterium]|nr:hypothetical protein [Isosphaeraceae bacterium]
MTNPPRITDDGERVALGLEPIDDTPTPAKRARAIAEALWDDDPRLADALKNQCAMGRSSIPQVRRESLFFQAAHGLLVADKEELGLSREKSLRSHDWDALWSEVSTMDA